MKLVKNTLKLATLAATFLMTQSALAAAAWGTATGPSIGQLATNTSGSGVGISGAMETFLYCLGVFFMIVFILTAWKYKKSEGREGNVGLIMLALVLAAVSMGAPTYMGVAQKTILGSTTAVNVTAPAAVAGDGN
jgi:hypothetical protein